MINRMITAMESTYASFPSLRPAPSGPMTAESSRWAFTLIELLVVVTVIAVLAAMLLPAIRTVRDSALSVSCKSQERQMGLALLLYADLQDGLLPPRYIASWDLPPEWLGDYLYSGGYPAVWTHPRLIGSTMDGYDLVNGQVPAQARSGFRCPASGRATQDTPPDYGMSALVSPDIWTPVSMGRWTGRLQLARFYQPSLVAVLTDASEPRWEVDPSNLVSAPAGVSVGWWPGQWSPFLPIRRHMDGLNLLFADGHVGYSRTTREDALAGVFRLWPQ
jgi:prepilin-type processing-associated H-X9-DG protein/prepilin-type N-terminal cleavage/methylation domain-containing protein